MPLAACGLLLMVCGCKGRHADAAPTGETVEVTLEEMAVVDSMDAVPVVPVADTAVARQSPDAEHNTALTAPPAAQEQAEEPVATPAALPEPVLPAAR